MARFKERNGLNEIVARMVAPNIGDVAKKVETEARKLAPPVKEWTTMRDALVRKEHRQTDRQRVPANLRFDLPSHPWDREHRGVGERTYMMRPKDYSSKAYVNIIHCRCWVVWDQQGVARHIKAGQPNVEGPVVKARVLCDAHLCVDAEFGTTYPDGNTSYGMRFMGTGAARAAAASRGRR
ncbi:hypothetical protein ABN028_20050 [Actinopolymorpha sp. B17G11]|uniref:hypothetical protein n=1 Tax=Actinopolymorpha sp. B17G11 TaxID=3160861 RepID=UPI0032E39095